MHATPISSRRAIFLDALGTLIRLHDPSPALRELLRERHGFDVTLADARRAMGAEMSYYRRSCLAAADERALRALREDCARILRDELGLPLEPTELIGTLLAALRFDPYEDVVPALERWRDGGLRLVVVSNWDVSLHDVLERTGLRPLLDGVVVSAQLGVAKPAPAIFAAALELAGVPPEQATHIGDSVEEDVAGARAAGIEPLLLVREGDAPHAPDGVRTIASLREA
jgi:putative hydrolase of the HAD superfamily